ncbi:hypothetical protein [Streptacidiphilus sp. P02-A3a]|uniref:hypothetical protein n=1 Tax=Streptacidiphilus sp. P02-A3a TaxID=2704468 RepID=UPI0015FB264A|nr:hypothetical protein [Streptacidiphilus sp. P02-A3a]QMU72478.1 hypothetical protein GXP74_33765 [Streptacidiphilus sp. P02-A3a]
MTQPPAPAGQTVVDPGVLAAGVGEMGALVGQCEGATNGAAQALVGMQAAVGHPGLAGSLNSANETAVQVMLAVGKLLAYVGEGLGQSAQQYSDTESANVAVMKSVHATIA